MTSILLLAVLLAVGLMIWRRRRQPPSTQAQADAPGADGYTCHLCNERDCICQRDPS